MKNLFTLVMVALLCLPVSGQKSVDRLINKMKKHDKAVAVTLPGWVIRTGFHFISDEEEEINIERGYKDIVDGIKQLRVLVIDEEVQFKNTNLNSIVEQIKEKDGYVDYATVREKNKLVRVIVKEKDTKIKSLVVLANTDDGFTILRLKTDIEMTDLKNANLSYNKSKKSQS